MLLTLLILTSIFSDIQARFDNEKKDFGHLKGLMTSTESKTSNLCSGNNVEECAAKHPEEIKQCKVCGLNNPLGTEPMVINGKPVNPPYKYPWKVAIVRYGHTICGGSIISDSYILTAAHCISSVKNGTVVFDRPNQVSVGFVRATNGVEMGPATEEVIPHPEYAKKPMRNDIALLKLKEKITCGKFRNPICLPSADLNINMDSVLHYSGWGAIRTKPIKNSKVLLEGSAKLVDLSVCKKRSSVKDDSYCFVGEGSSPCFGDSGGSMVYHFEKFYTIGVASRVTHKDCLTDKPFIYTAVPKAIQWIEKIAGTRIKP